MGEIKSYGKKIHEIFEKYEIDFRARIEILDLIMQKHGSLLNCVNKINKEEILGNIDQD